MKDLSFHIKKKEEIKPKVRMIKMKISKIEYKQPIEIKGRGYE